MKIILLALAIATGFASAGAPTPPAAIEAEASTKKVSYKIKGMACQSCANYLTTLLGKTKGVTKVNEVDFKTSKVTVTFDPKVTDESKIKAAINSTRYKVVEPAAPSK